MNSCGYACISKLFKMKGVIFNLEEHSFNKKSIFTFADFKKICDIYGIDGRGYFMEYDDIPNKCIMHLEISYFKHYIVLLKKGLFCIYYDNHGYHIIYSGILRLLYSNYVFIVR